MILSITDFHFVTKRNELGRNHLGKTQIHNMNNVTLPNHQQEVLESKIKEKDISFLLSQLVTNQLQNLFF